MADGPAGIPCLILTEYPVSMDTLNGKIAIVTGGTRGIGRAIAERLLAEGAEVAVCGRSPTPPSGRRRSWEDRAAFGMADDIANVDAVRAFFAAVDGEFGGLDILVNNAGRGTLQKVGEMTPEEWHRNIDLNLNGAFYCAHEALARFKQRGGGFIVNISSLAGAQRLFSGGAAITLRNSG